MSTSFEEGNPFNRARRVLRRFLERCEDAPLDEFLLEVERMVTACRADPFLRRPLDDFERDFDGFVDAIRERDEALVQELVDLRTAAESINPALNAPLDPEEGPRRTLAGFDALIANRQPLSLTDVASFDRRPSDAEELLTTLQEIIGWWEPTDGEQRERRREFLQDLKRLRQDQTWLARAMGAERQMHPYPTWAEMLEKVALINPTPVHRTVDDEDAVLYYARTIHWLRKIRAAMYGEHGRTNDKESFRAWRESFTPRLRRLVDELEWRLGTRASHEAILERYRQRCMLFRREDLRALVDRADNTGKTERVLVADAATFLYDQGFDVITELSLGVSRLDIFSEAQALLIEGKIYRHKTSPLTAIKQGLRQLLTYVDRLRSPTATTDNYLLIYRIDGPRVELPTHPLVLGQTTIRLVHVDLGDASESGSRAASAQYWGVVEIVSDVLEAAGS